MAIFIKDAFSILQCLYIFFSTLVSLVISTFGQPFLRKNSFRRRSATRRRPSQVSVGTVVASPSLTNTKTTQIQDFVFSKIAGTIFQISQKSGVRDKNRYWEVVTFILCKYSCCHQLSFGTQCTHREACSRLDWRLRGVLAF